MLLSNPSTLWNTKYVVWTGIFPIFGSHVIWEPLDRKNFIQRSHCRELQSGGWIVGIGPRGALVASWLSLGPPGVVSSSVRAFFLQTLVSPHCPRVHSALPQKMRRCFTTSFGGDVKPSVPGDLARLAPGYSRPSLATSVVINPEGYYHFTNYKRFNSNGCWKPFKP